MTLIFQWVDPKNVGKKKGTYVGVPLSDEGIRSHLDLDVFCPTPRFENSNEVTFDKDQACQPITIDDQGTT